jgi:hypothetical protein
LIVAPQEASFSVHSHFARYSSANTNARLDTRRGAFFVAGAALGSCTRTPKKSRLLRPLETFWSHHHARWFSTSGGRTATAGMGHEGMPAAAADLPAALPLRQRAHLPSQRNQSRGWQDFRSRRASDLRSMLDSKQSRLKIETNTLGRRFGFIWARQKKSRGKRRPARITARKRDALLKRMAKERA